MSSTQPPFPQNPQQPTPPQGPMAAQRPEEPQGKDDKKVPTKRVTRLWFLFGGLALLTAFLAFMMSQPDQESVDEQFVAVTARAVPAHAELNASMFVGRSIPTELVEENAVTGATAEEAVAALNLGEGEAVHARYPLPVGAQVRPSYLSIESQLPAASQELEEGERLLTIHASVGAAIGGVLRVGDKVDIWGTSSVTPPAAYGVGEETVAVPVLTDIEIVAINLSESLVQSLGGSQLRADGEGGEVRVEDMLPGEPLPGMYTIKLPNEQVGRALLTDEYLDRMVLVYRGEDSEPTPWLPFTMSQVLCTPPGDDVFFDTPSWCADVNFDDAVAGFSTPSPSATETSGDDAPAEAGGAE